MIQQPSFNEIQKKLLKVISGELTREEVADWAFYFVSHDDQVKIDNFEDWDYLTSLCLISEMIYLKDHADYLYSIDDIKNWIENPRDEQSL